MDRKIELSFCIEHYLNKGTLMTEIDEGVQRYFGSFLILLKSESLDSVQRFLKTYLKILDRQKIPIFKMNTLITLYKRWKNHPGIIKEILFLSVRTRSFSLEEDFWYQIILHSNLNKDEPKLHFRRLSLLALMMNQSAIRKMDLKSYSLIIDVILELPVRTEDSEELKSNHKNSMENPYFSMFLHIKRMIDLGVSALEIGEMIKNHYSQPDCSVRKSGDYPRLTDRLYEVLPPQYMAILKKKDIERLLLIYQYNPNLFGELTTFRMEELSGPVVVRELFQKFIISGIFIRNFCKGQMDELELSWFVHVLKGNSLASAEGLPVKLTKKGAHIFRCFGEWDLNVTKGVILAAMLSEVEDIQFSKRVLDSFRNPRKAQFWISTMSRLHRKGLETHEVREVMDYIDYKVFVDDVYLELKHKKLSNLRADVEIWHRELRAEEDLKKLSNRRLPDSGIPDTKIDLGEKQFEIKQLKKSADLYHEGKNLQHCVYSYRYQCFRNYCYIFSLRQKDDNGAENRLITIEVVGKKIVQAKGKFNRKPTEEEREIILLWAREKELKYVA